MQNPSLFKLRRLHKKCSKRKASTFTVMKSVLIRTGSVPVQSPDVSGSPRVCISRSDSLSGVFSREKSNLCRRSNASLHFGVNRRGDKSIRRVMSENYVVRSISGFSGGSRSFGARIQEEEYHSEGCDDDIDGPLSLKRRSARRRPRNRPPGILPI